ncbi:DinB family protein [Streptomyces justiciae]|uniref:DinB family protein n=1 Tax=Streptomyces justiciae TaxID=2780140 RepID=UPI002118D28F|nr:DinB family protein [Streptomyces justiciae]MCW8379610.1 DinB family protein [Streptomyces justiciae]
MDQPSVDRKAIHEDMERARAAFHELLDATDADLRRPTDGTRWTNGQLLFHMLFGYALMRPLLILMRIFGRLPRGASRAFARVLDAGTRPFDVVNYLGPLGGAKVLGRRGMGSVFDRVIAGLHRRLDAEQEAHFSLRMHYPTRWDPFFRDVMTIADLYRYPTEHFEFHRGQLTLPAGPQGAH